MLGLITAIVAVILMVSILKSVASRRHAAQKRLAEADQKARTEKAKAAENERYANALTLVDSLRTVPPPSDLRVSAISKADLIKQILWVRGLSHPHNRAPQLVNQSYIYWCSVHKEQTPGSTMSNDWGGPEAYLEYRHCAVFRVGNEQFVISLKKADNLLYGAEADARAKANPFE